MAYPTPLSNIIQSLRQRAEAFDASENFSERIENISTEFNYMCDYMLRGVNDPHRTALYADLKARLHAIEYDIDVRSSLMELPTIKPWMKQLNSRDTSAEALQSELLAHTDAKSHHEVLYLSFISLLTSYHWTDSTADEWAVFLSSPLPSVTDQAALVSALTISAIEHFDFKKAYCLTKVYTDSNSPLIKQRALIGCLLALCRISSDEYKEQRATILDAIGADTIPEIYMQMVSCANADKDSREISTKIMPDILRHQPFEVKDGKIIEKNENEDEDGSIDQMEKGVEKIIKMQRNGSDIFFTGFKQMKRMPFFHKYINWFMPFDKNHPDLSEAAKAVANTKFATHVTNRGPFCESDKYSFILGLAMTINNMPENVRQMMENGEMGPLGMHSEEEDMQAPSILRLQYMQDLYRFYLLCPLASGLYNPFSELHKCHIALAAVTHLSDTDKYRLCLYLIKKDKEMNTRSAVTKLLNRFDDLNSFERHHAHAELALTLGDYTTAISLYRKCLDIKPNDESCLRNLAKACYHNGDYCEAATYYDVLHTLKPTSISYMLNYCMAMTMNGKPSDVVNDIYRLDFENTDNLSILNTLTWVLLHAGKPEQALSTARRMMNLQESKNDFSSLLNIFYAHIANGLTDDAIAMMKAYASTLTQEQFKELPTTLMNSMYEDDALLSRYNIGEAERAIIIVPICSEISIAQG